MRHASLFTGIGGFDLAAEWAGWENVFQVEIDPFCQRLLAKRFPYAKKYTDVKQFDGRPYKGTVDVLSGGFPCQPYSTAGKRLGKADDRHLWPEYARIIREISPRWVIGENVRGLISWNGGLVFDEVQADLEAAGYEVWPFLLPAAGVGAPHRRDRIWFIAHSNGDGQSTCSINAVRVARILGNATNANCNGHGRHDQFGSPGCPTKESDGERDKREWVRGDAWRIGTAAVAANSAILAEREPSVQVDTEPTRRPARAELGCTCGRGVIADAEGNQVDRNRSGRFQAFTTRINEQGPVTNTNSDKRPEGGMYPAGSGSAERYTRACTACASGNAWQNFPTQPPVCGGDDGIPNRVDRLKALGNAVVPQVVYQIFKAIDEYEHLTA